VIDQPPDHGGWRPRASDSPSSQRADAVGRYYDPQTGQFLTIDPLVDVTGQPYSYAGSDPVNIGDPSGLCPLPAAGDSGDVRTLASLTARAPRDGIDISIQRPPLITESVILIKVKANAQPTSSRATAEVSIQIYFNGELIRNPPGLHADVDGELFSFPIEAQDGEYSVRAEITQPGGHYDDDYLDFTVPEPERQAEPGFRVPPSLPSTRPRIGPGGGILL
jgi:RHS repeat-associated protein